jgi:hypothetical protein
VGYPKSGNTWVARLTADLVDAPVCGFWGRPETQELAVEGCERRAPIDVYKGHHRCDAAARDFAAANLVYVVRDVRDVALSGAHYFSFRDRSAVGRLAYLARSVRRKLAPRAEVDYRLRRMLEALAVGDASVSEWCARPWDEHVQGYLAADAFVVRYEDLLDDAEGQARRLLRHLGIERTSAQIRAALQRQSFAAARQRFLVAGDVARAKFLRAGRHGDWVSVLTAAQQAFCWSRFGATLALAGYPADGLAPLRFYGDEARAALPCRRRAG